MSKQKGRQHSKVTFNHCRTTISLPEDLKRRMEACPVSANWSGIAAAAFEEFLARVADGRVDGRPVTLDDLADRVERVERRLDAMLGQ